MSEGGSGPSALAASVRALRAGPGPFVTRVAAPLPDGRRLVATSRRHRKGLAPHVCEAHEVDRIPPTRRDAWRHLWAPRRLGWWIALLFLAGSACFAVGGWATTWPLELPGPMRSAGAASRIFFAGSLLFTAAAYLQLLEAANGDVSEAPSPHPAGWRWFGWRTRNLGWLASAVQLAGTVLFNVSTGDALRRSLAWSEQDVLIWSPDMLGCACFLVASLAAWVELSHGSWSFAPRSASWWSVVANAVGSIAFQVSGIYAFVRPGPPDPHALWLAGLTTTLGALCFAVGSALLIPELFDGPPRRPAPRPLRGV